MGASRKVKITLAVGVALVAAVVALTLTRSPPRVVRGAVTGPHSPLASVTGDLAVCQGNETLPAGVSAIRLPMWAFLGWKVHLVAYLGAQVLTEGSRGADWTSDSVTVPVKPLARTTSRVTLCFAIGPNSEPAIVLGAPSPERKAAVVVSDITPLAEPQARLPGRFGAEYLVAGSGSWWSRVGSVAQHVGLGRAFSGPWIAFLIAALMAAVAILAVRLTLRELP